MARWDRGRGVTVSLVLAWTGCRTDGDSAGPGGNAGGRQVEASGSSSGSGGTQDGGTANGGAASGGSDGGTPSGGSANGAAGGGGRGGTSTGGIGAGGAPDGGGGTGSGGTGTGGSGDVCPGDTSTGTPPTPLDLTGNTSAHDPTLIRIDDTYYRFWTGDFIPVATSKDLTNWSNASSVYPNRYPDWVATWLADTPSSTFNFPWAPDVSSFQGKVHLYSSFSAKFGDNISCITHLSTADVKGGAWTDHGPVLCTKGTENYNAIDADVGFDSDGKPYLAFGSFWDGIFAFELNSDGSRQGSTATRLAWANEIEAPVLFRRCNYYYLFVSWGLCCPGEGRSVADLTYRVVVGRASNILGPYADKTGKPMLDGGGSLVVQGDQVTWAAAGHSDVFVDGPSTYHVYHAYRQTNGSAVLRIVPLQFDRDGWPVPHQP